MACYLIIYDLHTEKGEEDRDKLRDAIMGFGPSERLSESSYAVVHGGPPEEVYDELKVFLDKNDFLLVISMKKPYKGWHSQEMHEWLNENLPDS